MSGTLLNECNFIEIDKTYLTEQAKYRLNETSKIENSFNQEINQRKSCSKKLSKYVTSFDYIEKVLIVLVATSSGSCIILSVSVVGAPVGTASASFTLIFSLTTGIIKNLLSTTRNKNIKHDKILMLAKSKLTRIKTLVLKALIGMEISLEEFNTIMKEKDIYEKMKENVKNISEETFQFLAFLQN